MEFRRVHRFSRHRRKRGFSPALVLVCLVFLTIVYGVGVSKLGTWLASSVVAPLIRASESSEIAQTPESLDVTPETSGEDVESRQFTLPSLHCYAVQIGVFSEEANAQAQAAQLQLLGAAGYILSDNGQYRVLAAGYPEKTDMEQVRSRLESDGIDSRSHEILTDGLRMMASGTAGELQSLESALAFCASLPEKLSALSVTFDRDSLSVTAGIDALSPIMEESGRHAALQSSFGAATAEMLSPVWIYLDEARLGMESLGELTPDDTVVFSSRLKRLYLEIVLSYQCMAENIEPA